MRTGLASQLAALAGLFVLWEVGVRAFTGCSGLLFLSLSSEVRGLGPEPFEGCGSLLTVEASGMSPDDFGGGEHRMTALLGFCSAERRFSGGKALRWADCAAKSRAELAASAIDKGLTNAFAYLTSHGLIEHGEFNELLERAQRAKAMEIVALLLEYRNAKLGGEGVFDRFSLDLQTGGIR